MTSPPVHWWGAQPLPDDGSVLLLQLGPFWLAASMAGAALRLVWSTGKDPLGVQLALSALEIGAPLPPGPLQELRLAVPPDTTSVALTPRLAPRAYVCRPVGSVVLPPGATLDAYVTTPLWMEVDAPTSALDVPTQQPNETWFGPDTTTGELCYSGRTALRTELAALDVRPHRAVTPVRLVNRSKAPLTLRRLRLPTPALPLFFDGEGRAWTPRVTLTLEDESGQAVQALDERPPDEVGPVTPVAPARQPPAAGLVSRAVAALLP